MTTYLRAHEFCAPSRPTDRISPASRRTGAARSSCSRGSSPSPSATTFPEWPRRSGARSARPRRNTTARSSNRPVFAFSGARRSMPRCASSGRRPILPVPSCIRSATAMSARSPTPGCTATTTRCARAAVTSTLPNGNRALISMDTMRSSPGARVKIGFQASLKLLRAGAHVIVTTRFPIDAAARYANEPDYAALSPAPADSRTRLAAHAERRALHPVSGGPPAPARLHSQQRLPDGATARRILSAPARQGERIRSTRCPRPWRIPLAGHGELRRALEGSPPQARRDGRRRGAPRGGPSAQRARFPSAATSMRIFAAARRCSPRTATTRIASRSTSERSTAGAWRCTRSRRRSCSKCISSTPSRPIS
jgi:hypothetical protein